MSISRPAQIRLQKEYKSIENDPVENITVKPLESNLLQWYFLIEGPINTPYHKGQYFGVIQFAPNYPFAPPDFVMYTPNGRFQPNAKICLSFSAFHKETWYINLLK